MSACPGPCPPCGSGPCVLCPLPKWQWVGLARGALLMRPLVAWVSNEVSVEFMCLGAALSNSPRPASPLAAPGTGLGLCVLELQPVPPFGCYAPPALSNSPRPASPLAALAALVVQRDCVCVCWCVPGIVPFHGGAARSTRPHALQAPSAAHHALPVSGHSSVVHVSLCRCVSCALCELYMSCLV
jgi:hypothetical protein